MDSPTYRSSNTPSRRKLSDEETKELARDLSAVRTALLLTLALAYVGAGVGLCSALLVSTQRETRIALLVLAVLAFVMSLWIPRLAQRLIREPRRTNRLGGFCAAALALGGLAVLFFAGLSHNGSGEIAVRLVCGVLAVLAGTVTFLSATRHDAVRHLDDTLSKNLSLRADLDRHLGGKGSDGGLARRRFLERDSFRVVTWFLGGPVAVFVLASIVSALSAGPASSEDVILEFEAAWNRRAFDAALNAVTPAARSSARLRLLRDLRDREWDTNPPKIFGATRTEGSEGRIAVTYPVPGGRLEVEWQIVDEAWRLVALRLPPIEPREELLAGVAQVSKALTSGDVESVVRLLVDAEQERFKETLRARGVLDPGARFPAILRVEKSILSTRRARIVATTESGPFSLLLEVMERSRVRITGYSWD